MLGGKISHGCQGWLPTGGRTGRSHLISKTNVISRLAGVKSQPQIQEIAMEPPFSAPVGFRWVCCKSFKHYITGKEVFPKKAKCFMFLVRNKRR